MASVTSQLLKEVTAHAQSDSLEDVREICAYGTYFPNNLRVIVTSSAQYNKDCSATNLADSNYPERTASSEQMFLSNVSFCVFQSSCRSSR